MNFLRRKTIERVDGERIKMHLLRVARRVLPTSRFGDKIYAFLAFVKTHRRLPNGTGFNDILYQAKIDGRLDSPLILETTDKIRAKEWINSALGRPAAMPTLAILNNMSDARCYNLQEGTIAKPAIGCAFAIRRRIGEAPIKQGKLETLFKHDHYRLTRERNYRTTKQKIIVEQLIWGQTRPKEIMFFCHKGRARLVRLDNFNPDPNERSLQSRNRNWDLIDIDIKARNDPTDVPKPKYYDNLLKEVEILATHFEDVRIDVYVNDTEYYFGEITHCAASAGLLFIPPETEFEFAKDYVNLDLEIDPKKDYKKSKRT